MANVTISDFRAKNPAYSDLSDDDLTRALHKKFYSDMPFDAFSQSFRGTTREDQQVQAQEPPKDLELGRAIDQGVRNLPKSAANTAGAIFEAVRHPIQTGKALADVTRGGLSKGAEFLGMEPTTREFIPAFDTMADFFKERYGGWENFKRTLAEDPVGVALDMSAFTGVGAVGAGTANLSKTSQALKAASAATDPVAKTARVAGALGRGAKSGSKELLGVTTGGGRAAIEASIKGGKDFVDAMRGRVSGGDILEDAKTAFQALKIDRANTYKPRLEALGKSGVKVDIAPVKAKLDKFMETFNIIEHTDTAGNPVFDFSRSSLNASAHSDVAELITMIREWGHVRGDTSPIMMDILKRRLDDFHSPSKNSTTIVNGLRKEVQDAITRAVPEYGVMTKDYARASQAIRDIESALSLGTRAGTDTAVRKLTSVLRDNFEFRKSMVDKLNEFAGKDLVGEIAGYNMRTVVPKGVVGRGLIGAEILMVMRGADPILGTALIAASPRVVGEFLNVLGKAAGPASSLAKKLPSETGQILFQGGRTREEIADLPD